MEIGVTLLKNEKMRKYELYDFSWLKTLKENMWKEKQFIMFTSVEKVDKSLGENDFRHSAMCDQCS